MILTLQMQSMIDYLKSTLEITNQKYTSADTSMNKYKLPRVFTQIPNWKRNSINLDLGGGKFDNATQFLYENFGCTNLIFDKFNRTNEYNSKVLDCILQNNGADTITCANVLNVIAEKNIRLEIIAQAYSLLKDSGVVYFQIYEGI